MSRVLLWWCITAGVFLTVAVLNISYYRWTNPEYITAGYVFIFSMPLWISPLGRALYVTPIWEIFKNTKGKCNGKR